MESWKDEKPLAEGDPRRMGAVERGLIKEAYHAMYHDMHGLAVLVDMIKVIYQSKAHGARHKDFRFWCKNIFTYQM